MTEQSPRPVIDLEVVESLKALDEDGGCGLFFELIDLFVNDAATQLRTLQSALASGDIKTLERAAHTLKSSSANIGASRLSGVCHELEKLGRSGSLEGVQTLVARTDAEYAQVCQALASMRS